MISRSFCALVLLSAYALFVRAAPLACGQEAAPDPPLPLKRVVLFSSSVGFFEHGGEIDGNRQIEFAFKASDINDLLKSLVVQDRSGGLVTAVNYGSPEPVTRTLRTFAIDLTDTPSLAEIFQQLRGQKVRVESPGAVTGVVVGVETRSLPVGDDVLEVEVLNLRTDEGLQSIRIENIARTRFLDPKIDREFQQALDLLATVHANDQKRVKLDFRGAGKRNVSVGYIQEAPVWKTSYRLVLADKEPPFLQGWAIVENTTPQDWRDVQLTLVSGRPISFLMDLYEPLFMARPMVTPEQHASLHPRVYDQDLAGRAQEFQGAAGRAAGGRGRGPFAGGMGGMGGGGGFFGGAPPDAGGPQRPFTTSVVPAVDGNRLDLKQGVASAASAEDVGELFRYVIKAPVTLGRNESAMLPIVNDAVKGEKIAIYNPAVHARHPLAGLRLTNTTPLHLLQGPITLFDGGEYAGDARIEDVPPGSTRLISYALDLETEVAAEEKPAQQITVGLQIRKGGLHVKHKVSRQVQFVVKNSSDHAKQVILERPIDPTWKTVQPPPTETTRSLHRFTVQAEPGKPATLTVVEEKDVVEEFLLATLSPAEIDVYLHLSAATPALKKALQDAIARKTAVAEIQSNRLTTEARLMELSLEQGRVRQNLQAVAPVKSDDPVAEQNRKTSRELVQRYLTKLADLETELERERTRLAGLRQDETRAAQQLEAFLQGLLAE